MGELFIKNIGIIMAMMSSLFAIFIGWRVIFGGITIFEFVRSVNDFTSVKINIRNANSGDPVVIECITIYRFLSWGDPIKNRINRKEGKGDIAPRENKNIEIYLKQKLRFIWMAEIEYTKGGKSSKKRIFKYGDISNDK